ncbi:MAG: KEOPS complex subunit Cgi121 [Candidatus Thermoplasmatota archaeon]
MSHIVAGARARVTDPEAVLRATRSWASEHGSEVCLADARIVFGRDHLESAALHAERARDSNTMATRSLAMETLLYAAGERQVTEAIRVAGLRPDTQAVGIVLFGRASVDDLLQEMGWSREDELLSEEGKSLEAFGISRLQAASLSKERSLDLVLEKVALVDLEK